MAEKNDEKTVNDIDNGVGSCDVCHGNHYVRKVMSVEDLNHKTFSYLQTDLSLYTTCPICVEKNALNTDSGPVTNSNDRRQLHQ